MIAPHGPADGYVRFEVRWTESSPPCHEKLGDLDALRTRLWDHGWIGATPEGIGFGNLSVRDPGGTFVITGTATGAERVLGPRGYTRVTAALRARNTVVCEGPVRASAETLTHAAVYEACPSAACVVHIHAADLWRRGLELGWPATAPDAEYGTPEIANAISVLVRTARGSRGVITLAGHRDGLVAYAPDLQTVEAELLAAERAARRA